MNKPSYDDLVEKLARLENEAKEKKELPHLHAFPEYKWSRDFKQSDNRMRLLCSANQVGKSSCLIQDVIEKACNKESWKKYFPKRKPKLFWYIYPDFGKVEDELRFKWPEFLPSGSHKEFGPYAWKRIKIKTAPAIDFYNAGVVVLFKTWGSDLQSSTVDAVFCDEEIPEKIYPEINMRLARWSGMFSMVFTATLNQQFWYDAIERIGQKGERFPDADKWQISMEYDCRYYANGTPSPWTKEAVAQIKKSCGSEIEIDRRVHGKFVTEIGLKYKTFNQDKNVKKCVHDTKDWHWYSGVDIGGGGSSHPGGIVILAVKPDYTFGVIKRMWKGSKEVVTTSGDILEKYKEMSKDLVMMGEFYDWANKDFGTLAERHGYNFEKANKTRDENMLNLLFKNEMLEIDEDCEHVDDFIYEVKSLKIDTPKTKAEDDLTDAANYATSSIPWDINVLKTTALLKSLSPTDLDEPKILNRDFVVTNPPKEIWSVDEEIDELNDLAGGFY